MSQPHVEQSDRFCDTSSAFFPHPRQRVHWQDLALSPGVKRGVRCHQHCRQKAKLANIPLNDYRAQRSDTESAERFRLRSFCAKELDKQEILCYTSDVKIA